MSNILRVDPQRPHRASIARAAALLKAGRLVAFPTETVYGLGANALDEAALRRVFAVKGRPATNPLIVHVADTATARRYVRNWPEPAETLARAYWPGPLTLVLPKAPEIPGIATAGLDTVALRVPAHPVALALLRAAGIPVAAPSANRSGQVSPTTAKHVADALGDEIDLILDGGSTRVGIESAVVDLTGPAAALLRPGPVSAAALERLIGPVSPPPTSSGAAVPMPGPGLLPRHYAPRAEFRLFDAGQLTAAELLCRQAKRQGKVVGALLLPGNFLGADHCIAMPAEPAAFAQQLYAALHALDAAGCELILAENAPASPEWDAVRDRLDRAATRDLGNG